VVLTGLSKTQPSTPTFAPPGISPQSLVAMPPAVTPPSGMFSVSLPISGADGFSSAAAGAAAIMPATVAATAATATRARARCIISVSFRKI
jgi:hypothetical protein